MLPLQGITVVGSIVGTRVDLREVFELHGFSSIETVRSGATATASPKAAFVRSSSSWMAGYRGRRFAKIAPFVKNTAATATRARRRAAVGRGGETTVPVIGAGLR